MADIVDLTDYSELFPGRFLAGTDKEFKGKKPVYTIVRVLSDDLGDDKDPDRKTIVAFKETEKALVLRKIQGVCLRAMFGSDVRNWIGKRVCLWATDTLMPMPTAKGEDRLCVRVFGSPDIESDITVEFKPKRRKPIVMTMKAPRKAAAADPAPTTTAPEAPADNAPNPAQ